MFVQIRHEMPAQANYNGSLQVPGSAEVQEPLDNMSFYVQSEHGNTGCA